MHAPGHPPSVGAMAFMLSRPARRTVLVLHILCGAGWMGIDLALGVLAYTAWLSGDGPTVAAAYSSIRMFVPPVVSALAVGMLVTGVTLGLGTRYGLVQWWWVTVKLALGLVLTALVFVALVPTALAIPSPLSGTAEAVRDALGRDAVNLLFPPPVSFTALAFALVLSVWKPWGRTPWARPGRERRVSAPSTARGSR